MGSLPRNHVVFLKTLIFSTLGFASFLGMFPPKEKDVELMPIVASQQKNKTVYVSLYSDKNITQNAKDTNPTYKHLTFLDRNVLLANTISTVSQNTSILGTTTKEIGSWLWTPISYITKDYSEKIIAGAKENNINVIYLSIDNYLDIFVLPDGDEKNEKQNEFDSIIERFITLANKNGISVDAEAGWRNWAQPGNSYKALAVLNYVVKFNASHKQKFRGLQYDVEPYLLEEYKTDKVSTLKNFLNLIDQSVSSLDRSGLELSVVIPEFYDGTNDETPLFIYKGKTLSAYEHLLNVLDRRNGSKIIVMSYRNYSLGNDGSIDVSATEILKANNHKTKVIIAQETGDVEPSSITFYNTSKKYYSRQLGILERAFSKEKSFGGVAIHYINSFLDL